MPEGMGKGIDEDTLGLPLLNTRHHMQWNAYNTTHSVMPMKPYVVQWPQHHMWCEDHNYNTTQCNSCDWQAWNLIGIVVYLREIC